MREVSARRPWLGLLLVLAASLAAVCATRVSAQQAPGVTVERVAPDRWRATYRFHRPVTRLVFDRGADFFRERVWKVVTPGYRLEHEGDEQVVALDTARRAQTRLIFEFPTYSASLPKEYELFLSFTDGGVALYTGHFTGLAIGVRDADSVAVRSVRVVPPAGAAAIVRGQVSRGPVTYADSVGDGTYVYLGRARPVETADVIGIIDPGLPQWAATSFHDFLPRLFAEYTNRLGTRLPWKPMVLFAYRPEPNAGSSASGGTLPGLITMSLAGDGWRTPDSGAAGRVSQLVAHESAHLWNGQLVANQDGTAGAWMHEGSADAMAFDMLLESGVIDSALHREIRQRITNNCALAVSAGSVETALPRRDVRAVYNCGYLMALWTEAAYRQGDSSATLFTFWRNLIAAAKPTGQYDVGMYFDVLRNAGVSDAVIGRMRAFLTSADSMRIAVEGLQALGVAVSAGRGEPPEPLQDELAKRAIAHLMRQACDRMDFTWGKMVRTGAVQGCEPFAKALEISRVNGASVQGQGAAIYDAVQAACGGQSVVVLQGEQGDTLSRVSCRTALPARPAWYRWGGEVPAGEAEKSAHQSR